MFIQNPQALYAVLLAVASIYIVAPLKADTINLKEFVITPEILETDPTENDEMQVEISNCEGKTFQTDNLNFDLKLLPVGPYTVKVIKNGEEVNSVDVNSLPDNNNVITVEALDSNGNKVYHSSKRAEMFDLQQLPAGTYVINIYQGKHLINTKKISKA